MSVIDTALPPAAAAMPTAIARARDDARRSEGTTRARDR